MPKKRRPRRPEHATPQIASTRHSTCSTATKTTWMLLMTP